MTTPLVPRNHVTPLSELQPMMKDMDCEVIVLTVEKTQFKAQELMHVFLVADASGSIDLRLWTKPELESLVPGDILRISNAEAKMYQGKLYLSMLKGTGRVRRIGEDILVFSDQPNHTTEFAWIPNPSGGGVVRVPADQAPPPKALRPPVRAPRRGGFQQTQGFRPSREEGEYDPEEPEAFNMPPPTASGMYRGGAGGGGRGKRFGRGEVGMRKRARN